MKPNFCLFEFRLYLTNLAILICTAEFHCEDFATGSGAGNWNYYVRSPLLEPMEESCIRVHKVADLLVHFDLATGVSKSKHPSFLQNKLCLPRYMKT